MVIHTPTSLLVPLAIINHYKPTRPLDHNINLDELYPEGMHERDPGKNRRAQSHRRGHAVNRERRVHIPDAVIGVADFLGGGHGRVDIGELGADLAEHIEE